MIVRVVHRQLRYSHQLSQVTNHAAANPNNLLSIHLGPIHLCPSRTQYRVLSTPRPTTSHPRRNKPRPKETRRQPPRLSRRPPRPLLSPSRLPQAHHAAVGLRRRSRMRRHPRHRRHARLGQVRSLLAPHSRPPQTSGSRKASRSKSTPTTIPARSSKTAASRRPKKPTTNASI
jgi:hypothetical protein